MLFWRVNVTVYKRQLKAYRNDRIKEGNNFILHLTEFWSEKVPENEKLRKIVEATELA